MKPNEIRAEFLRRNKKISSVAGRLGVSSPYVSQVISGARPGNHVRRGIAEALGLPVEQIWPEKS